METAEETALDKNNARFQGHMIKIDVVMLLMVATCVVMLVGELPELSGLGVHTPIVPPSLPTRMRAGAEM